MPRVELRVRLQPKQQDLYNFAENSPATWLGFGGSRGGAKSGGARRVMLKRRIEHPGTRGAIFRRTYDLVKENHIDKYLEEYPILAQWYHVGDKEIRIPNGSTLAFRYAETKKDVDAHIGKEYYDVVVDQAEAFSEQELITLKSCCRWPGVNESACKFMLTFNPGNIGHAFLKRIFYDRKYTKFERDKDYAFIQAYGWDNVEWARSALRDDGHVGECGGQACGACESCTFYAWDTDKRFDFYVNRTQFGREQNALPPALRIGWLLGNMDKFAGQYYDNFSPERHVAHVRPEEWHTRWLGIDWGWDHESVCEWASQIRPKVTAFYREFHGGGRSAKALAQEIVDRTPEDERTMIKHIFLSHDAFASRNERDTVADQMAEVFRANKMPYPETGTKDVGGRASLMYDMFAKDEIVFDPNCRKLIETIPMICIDGNKPLDRNEKLRPIKFDGDDAIDACWYALTYRMSEAKVPHQVTVMEEANKIADPVARWFYLRKHSQDRSQTVIQPRVQMPWEAQR